MGSRLPSCYLAIGLATAEATGSDGWITDAMCAGAIGAAAGIVVGAAGGWLLVAADLRKWTSPASRQLAVLALSIGSYLVAVALGGNGFIAAFVGGLAFGVATRRRAENALRLTEAQGSVLAIVVWTVFGITVGAALIAGGLDLRAIAYALLSLTVIRMVPVAVALVGCQIPACDRGLHRLVRSPRAGVDRVPGHRPRGLARRWSGDRCPGRVHRMDGPSVRGAAWAHRRAARPPLRCPDRRDAR